MTGFTLTSALAASAISVVSMWKVGVRFRLLARESRLSPECDTATILVRTTAHPSEWMYEGGCVCVPLEDCM